MMWLLLAVLALGFLVGRLVRSGLARRTGKTLSTVGLLFLLFAMGVRLGQEEFLRMKLASFGLSVAVSGFRCRGWSGGCCRPCGTNGEKEETAVIGIVLSLGAGILFGFSGLFPSTLEGFLERWIDVSLYVLVFGVGMELAWESKAR